MDDMEKKSNFTASVLERLKKLFMKLDSDGSVSIDREEFFLIPLIATNPLSSRMIAIFDEDGGGTVDFQEFVGGLSASKIAYTLNSNPGLLLYISTSLFRL